MNPISNVGVVNRPSEMKIALSTGQHARLHLDWDAAGTGSEGSIALAVDRHNRRRYAFKILELEKEAAVSVERMYTRTNGYRLVQKRLSEAQQPYVNVPREIVSVSMSSVAIISDWAGVGLNGRLADLARRNPSFLSSKLDRDILCYRLAHDVGHGLTALHQAGLGWRDGKFGNVAFDDQQEVFSIVDLRMCCELHSVDFTQVFGGTPEWQAPEIVSRQGSCQRSDMYSLGLMIARLATRNTMWKPTQQSLAALDGLQQVGFLDPTIKQIITHLLEVQAANRWSAAQLLEFLAQNPNVGRDPQGDRSVGKILAASDAEHWTFQKPAPVPQNHPSNIHRKSIEPQQPRQQLPQAEEPPRQTVQQPAKQLVPQQSAQQSQQPVQQQPVQQHPVQQQPVQQQPVQQHVHQPFGAGVPPVPASARAPDGFDEEIALVSRLKQLDSVREFLQPSRRVSAEQKEQQLSAFAAAVVAVFKSKDPLDPRQLRGVRREMATRICAEAKTAGIHYFAHLRE